MALKMSSFAKKNDISVLVHFPGNLSNMKSTIHSGYVLSKPIEDDLSVEDYLLQIIDKQNNHKIDQVLQLVKIDLELKSCLVTDLSLVESQKLQFAYALLLQSKVIIIEHFFANLIYSEQQYFKRLVLNLVHKQDKSVVVIEDDMDFICEFVRKITLFTKGEHYITISDFYDERIYQYVMMPKTVELIKYFEQKGHHIDHEVTFNETLKAIYRGVT